MPLAPQLKTRAEGLRLRRSGRLLPKLFLQLAEYTVPGVRPLELVELVERFAVSNGATCAQKGYNGFPSAICCSINEIAAHGVPNDHRLREGDLVTIDCVLSVDGWHADAAWTYAIGDIDPDGRRLVRAAWHSMRAAVLACRAGARFDQVAQAGEAAARSFGCAVLGDFTGHGIGRSIHEAPSVPFSTLHGERTPVVPGMVITIEPVLTLGEPRVQLCSDGFGYETVDGARTAQFECTVAVYSDRTEVLTLGAGDVTHEFPPFV